MKKRIITAESVTSGHPDKLADLIADTILDECLMQDGESKVACEVMLCHNKVLIGGEISTNAKVNYLDIAKRVIEKVGYSTTGVEFECRVNSQSQDISDAVGGTPTPNSPSVRLGFSDEKGNNNLDETSRFTGGASRSSRSAGDQGVVFGYACRETENLMPLPIELAHKLTQRLEYCRQNNIIEGLLPDGKALVTVEYENDKFSRVVSIIVSAQHSETKDISFFRWELMDEVVDYVFKDYDLSKTNILINPSERFVIGGFKADTGLTGRKLMVDSYGGSCPHGGGAFSGKDATKVDRSGAYMARYIAKNIVAAKLAEKCQVSLSYAIGMPYPVAIDIDTFNTGVVPISILKQAVEKVFDLSVDGMIQGLELNKPIFAETASGGHFGRDVFKWECIDKADQLTAAVNAHGETD